MIWTAILLPLLISFGLTVIVMPVFISYFLKKRYGQEIREEGPKWHNKKAGTPTMGGVVFVVSAIITSIIVGFIYQRLTVTMWLLLFLLITYGMIGFADDFLKIFRKQNEGLNSKQKFLAQLVVGIIFFVTYYFCGYPMSIKLPFITIHLGIFYALFVIIWLVGFSNAVNLTDGLDGLVTGLSIIAFGTYGVIAFYQVQYDVLFLCLAIVGSLLGFFFFNHKPAKIFMGDVGSLALGGLLAGISIMLHQEWTLLLIGLVFIIETLSVIIQVTVFRATGKRVFKMSPIHHHFEMSGWSEWKVDIVFWTVGLVMSLFTLWLLQ